MRIVVTGCKGQVVAALKERAPVARCELVPLGRPELDLADLSSIAPAITNSHPDIIVSAAAYTAVDQAEREPELAQRINAAAPGVIAAAAKERGVPVIHLSTDYVFAGDIRTAYSERDSPDPRTVYGRSKLQGEEEIAVGTADHVILRTAWVYSPFGTNFVKTMLRLAQERNEIRVVFDQVGNPTSAFDIADAIFVVAKTLIEKPSDARFRGVFHLVAQGRTSWAKFASAILQASREMGGPTAEVVPIATSDYPTLARRPANSCLATDKMRSTYGIVLPNWSMSLGDTLRRLI